MVFCLDDPSEKKEIVLIFHSIEIALHQRLHLGLKLSFYSRIIRWFEIFRQLRNFSNSQAYQTVPMTVTQEGRVGV